MLNLEMLRTMGQLLARQAREKAATEGTKPNEVIDMLALLKPWQEGPQTAGEVVTYEGAPYKVVQAHDSTGNPGWNPKAAPALFAPYHATDKAHALPYAAPTGAHDAYYKGEWVTFGGKAYECLMDGCVYDPNAYPAAWKEESDV